MIIEVYSKNNCPYCSEATKLLQTLNLPFEEKKVGIDVTREQLLKRIPSARSVPQIIIDGKCIGGYIELTKYDFNAHHE